MKEHFLKFNQRSMTVWEAIEFLNELVDDSDPDIELPQIEHILQTAEAIRKDGHPRWFILTGLIHDLGKILYSWILKVSKIKISAIKDIITTKI